MLDLEKTGDSQFGRLFDTPWIRRQTDGHILIGPIYKRFPIGWVFVATAIGMIARKNYDPSLPIAAIIGKMIDNALLIAGPFTLLILPRYQQGAITWLVTKFCGAVAASFLVEFGVKRFQTGRADAWPMFLLGMLWLPVELLPGLVAHQRIVSVARWILTIPVVYVGIKSGEWHW